LLIAHLADTHLGVKPYGFEWAFEAVLEHFRQAIDKALEEHVDAILVSGDFFDKPRPPNRALKTAIETVSRALEKGIRVYSVLGEHDIPKVSDIPPQYLVPGLRILGVEDNRLYECFEIDGREYCVGGVSHIPLKYKPGLKKKLLSRLNHIVEHVNERSIVMMHQNIVNFERFEPGLEISEIPEKPRYIAMGHLHRRIIHRRDNGQVIAYPGSLDIIKRDEIGEWRRNGKGFYLVDLSGDEPRIEKIDTEVIPQEIVSTGLKDLEYKVSQTASKLPRDKKSILHVIITLSPNEKADVSSILRRIVSRYSKNIYVRLEKKYTDIEISGGTPSLPSIDEVDVIASILDPSDPRKYRGLAEKIYLLKQALVREDYDAVDSLVEEITSHSFWAGRLKYPQITLPSTTTTTQKPGTSGAGETGKSVKRGSRRNDLLSYLGGGGSSG
jgi:exonuclease SbcD